MKYTCVFESDGHKTTAKMIVNKLVIAKAEAKCSSEDEFDFNKGIEICLERMKEIKVGDKVKVIDKGESYTIYTDWFELNKIPMKQAIRYDYDTPPNESEVYIVTKIGTHHISKRVLLLIENIYSNKLYLISYKGVKKI